MWQVLAELLTVTVQLQELLLVQMLPLLLLLQPFNKINITIILVAKSNQYDSITKLIFRAKRKFFMHTWMNYSNPEQSNMKVIFRKLLFPCHFATTGLYIRVHKEH
jgi:hypothetical protein